MKLIENELLSLGIRCAETLNEEDGAAIHPDPSSRLHELTHDRKSMHWQGRRDEANKIGKQIQREIRAISGAKKKTRIDKVLVQFKGLKSITGIWKNDKRHFIGSMRGKNGDLQTDRQNMSDVFADFSEKLYA